MNNAEINLKPCPFCGRDVDLVDKTPNFYLKVVCRHCFVSMTDTFEEGAEHLVKEWNTRVSE